jgi:hypothetical protein
MTNARGFAKTQTQLKLPFEIVKVHRTERLRIQKDKLG